MDQNFTRDSFNPNVQRAEYAVRGPIVVRALELREQLAADPTSVPFEKLIMCNIGNPQAVGQQPLTFHRQILAGCLCPSLLDQNVFPDDVTEHCRELLGMTSSGSIGAYTHSQGMLGVRQAVAQFIQDRDGVDDTVDPGNVFLSNGASQAIQNVLRAIIRNENDGILVSVPQYPLYSATITVLGGTRVDYHLEEEGEWSLNPEHLRQVIEDALEKNIVPRAIVVINPSNPTGSCLPRENIQAVIQLAAEYNLLILADEVYQENVYGANPFVSFRSVLKSMGSDFDGVVLFSFHSCSKGIFGECGLRGGFVEICNGTKSARDEFYKLVSIGLCANTIGQLMVYCMCVRPKEGDPSHEMFVEEYDRQLNSLKERAAFMTRNLNTVDGISCQQISGAMYAFPQISLPQNYVDNCKERGVKPDFEYCMALLESSGICVVPGSGFGQKDGTFHFRTTILPPMEDLEHVIQKMGTFHTNFVSEKTNGSQ